MHKSQGDFSNCVQEDIDAIQPGQCHCYMHLIATVNPAGKSRAEAIADSLATMVPEHLPETAQIFELSDSDCGIWLPRHSKEDATTLARFLRYSFTNRLLSRADRPVNGDCDEASVCALGIVVVKKPNWTADALIRTGQITAATARLAGANGIRLADQVDSTFSF